MQSSKLQKEAHMITQLVWDFDGTLFDSYPAMADGFRNYLQSRNHNEPVSEIESLLRISFGTAWSHYCQKYSLDESEISVLKEYQAAAENALQPYPHCLETLQILKERGCHHYLLTHRGASALEHMQSVHMLSLFDRCITAEDGFPRKPDPGALHALISEYDHDHSHWLMIGDRKLDIDSGINAGIQTCLFDTGSDAKDASADFIMIDFRQMLTITGVQKN